ncbi:MAG: hypothetical protein AVDCRST_MAG56-4462, partial [uncultured Cytophagales bacterium]
DQPAAGPSLRKSKSTCACCHPGATARASAVSERSILRPGDSL